MELRKPNLTVSLPFDHFQADVEAALSAEDAARIRLVQWKLQDGVDPEGAEPADIDMVVLPFHTTSKETTWQYASTHDLGQRLSQATNARLFQAPSIGVEGLAECLPAQGVLANAVGVMEPPTAELAVTLLLTLLREVPGFIRSAPMWDNHRSSGLIGKRVLLIGYGGIGSRVERMLAGFDPAVVVRVGSRARLLEDGTPIHSADALPELIGDADAIICSLPLNENTRGLIGAEEFAAMREGAAFVNIGRGPVVDTAALLAELDTRSLRIALDVTDPEPLPPDHPLWSRDDVLITPHVGGNSDASHAAQADLIIAQMRALLDGRKPMNIVAGSW